MTRQIYIFLGLIAFFLTSCNTVKKDTQNKEIYTNTDALFGTYVLDTSSSSLEWKGTWIGGENDGMWHNGTVKVASGNIVVNKKGYTGKFVVDMNAMKNFDIEDPDTRDYLITDLKSDYFFDVEQFPTVDVTIKATTNDSATVTVNVLGIPITQKLPIKKQQEGGKAHLSGTFFFDFKEANIRELFANPLEMERGGVSSKIQFVLNLNLLKKVVF